jgi:hypothetical protein
MASNIEQIFMAQGLPAATICLDGAATSHMVPNRLQEQESILQNYKTFDTPREVEVGGGHRLRAFGTGILMIGEYKFTAMTVDQLQFILLSEPQIIIKGDRWWPETWSKSFMTTKETKW